MIYLDHNATTAPLAAAVTEMCDVLQRAWANPSSMHGPGQAARRTLADSRTRVARFLGCQGSELVFTSGASESNALAVRGALAARQAEGRTRIVMSAVEHPGLLALGQALSAQGMPVDLIPVDGQGRLDLDAARALIGPDVALVSVMAANNETGVVMPIAAIAALAQAQGVWLHVDATQALGKQALRFDQLGAQLMSVSGHKIGGPKGVGALVVQRGLTLPALMPGKQERHRRGGTENLPAIAGFAAACEHAAATLDEALPRMRTLRDRLQQGLLQALPGVQVHGAAAERLPNTLSLRFGDLHAEQVLARLERAGVVASSGAACTAGGTEPSHVLRAMGESLAHVKGGVRLSLGPDTRAVEIEQALLAIVGALEPLLAAPADPRAEEPAAEPVA